MIFPENKGFELREDTTRGVYVNNLSLVEVDNEKEIFQILNFGNLNRTHEATKANETSSRSHAVL